MKLYKLGVIVLIAVGLVIASGSVNLFTKPFASKVVFASSNTNAATTTGTTKTTTVTTGGDSTTVLIPAGAEDNLMLPLVMTGIFWGLTIYLRGRKFKAYASVK